MRERKTKRHSAGERHYGGQEQQINKRTVRRARQWIERLRDDETEL